MKNIFRGIIAVLLVAAGLFVANNVVQAERVQLYDGVSVDKILKIIREKGEIYNFTIGNKYYYTSDSGSRYCRSYFCDSDVSRIIFTLSNKDKVYSALIVVYIDDAQKDDITAAYAFSLNTLIEITGLNNAERERVGFDIMNYMNKSIKEAEDNGEKVNMDKTFSVWSTKSKRYIDIRIFTDYSDDTLNISVFAHT